jgi:hypothetical protein
MSNVRHVRVAVDSAKVAQAAVGQQEAVVSDYMMRQPGYILMLHIFLRLWIPRRYVDVFGYVAEICVPAVENVTVAGYCRSGCREPFCGTD